LLSFKLGAPRLVSSNLRSCSRYRIELTRITAQYSFAVSRCGEESSLRQRLEAQFQRLEQTLHAWSEARAAWYKARSTALTQELQHDLDLLKQRYLELKQQLQQHQHEWRALLATASKASLPMP
jgi:chromosome segregation ATPase